MGSAECDLQLFADSNTWLEHELQNHRWSWVCTLCRAGSFRSSDLFRAHVDEAHPSLTESETHLLSQASRRPLNLIPATDCPFCDEWEAKIRASIQKQEGTTTGSAPATRVTELPEGACEDQSRTDVIVVECSQFRKHVGLHMEQLALFAIPRTAGQEHDSSRGSSHAAQPSIPEFTSNASEAELSWLPDPPLHLAAFEGDVKEVERLLNDGADVEASGETWGTALSAAETGGHTQLVALLRSWQSNNLRPPVSQAQESMTENKLQGSIAFGQPYLPRFSYFVPVPPEERLGRFITPSLQLTNILGSGAFGVIYAAIDRKDEAKYAVKCLSKLNADGTALDRRQQGFQVREIRLHYLASDHPNVVSLLKIIDNPDCIYMIMEYCPEGDLFFNITECGAYVGKDEVCKRAFLQILDAVEHCHSIGIYHRDLQPKNFLVADGGKTLKLTDFGLATTNDRSEEYGCGSTCYISPGTCYLDDQRCHLALKDLTDACKRRMFGSLIEKAVLLLCAKRCLVPRCHSSQPNDRKESVEASLV